MVREFKNESQSSSRSLHTLQKRTTPIITSSGTNFPAFIYSSANIPTSLRAATAARSISPVLKCTTPYLAWMISHCVPFPLAGAPAMMIFGGALVAVDTTSLAAVEDVQYPRALAQLVRDATFCLLLLARNAVAEATTGSSS